jgi:NAD(P)-dependent dehydrogenase (short-subunit alcohol dehydrogenase family)
MPAAQLKGLSSYLTSKTAQVKVLEFLAAENPGVFCASVHPGMVKTEMFDKSGGDEGVLPMDTGILSLIS